MSQVVTNLVQNAAEALERRGASDEPARVILRLTEEGGRAIIEVEDNGPGLPIEGREKLLEPYVTTRKKGTGLGLAIVRKILEDHGGTLTLGDSDSGGALIRAQFAMDSTDRKTSRTTPILVKESAAHGE